MDLFETITGDIKKAMLARESLKLEALRAIKSALLIIKTQKGSGEISPENEIKILQKLVKQRKDSAQMYIENSRNELAEKELAEAEIIKIYLPESMNEAEIEAVVKNIIDKTGASSMKDMGKVMGMAAKEMAGKADNKIISEKVKQLLNS